MLQKGIDYFFVLLFTLCFIFYCAQQKFDSIFFFLFLFCKKQGHRGVGVKIILHF